mgnify:CR=1 FL=1
MAILQFSLTHSSSSFSFFPSSSDLDVAAKVVHLDANLEKDVLAVARQVAVARHVLVALTHRVRLAVHPARVLLARDLVRERRAEKKKKRRGK